MVATSLWTLVQLSCTECSKATLTTHVVSQPSSSSLSKRIKKQTVHFVASVTLPGNGTGLIPIVPGSEAADGLFLNGSDELFPSLVGLLRCQKEWRVDLVLIWGMIVAIDKKSDLHRTSPPWVIFFSALCWGMIGHGHAKCPSSLQGKTTQPKGRSRSKMLRANELLKMALGDVAVARRIA